MIWPPMDNIAVVATFPIDRKRGRPLRDGRKGTDQGGNKRRRGRLITMTCSQCGSISHNPASCRLLGRQLYQKRKKIKLKENENYDKEQSEQVNKRKPTPYFRASPTMRSTTTLSPTTLCNCQLGLLSQARRPQSVSLGNNPPQLPPITYKRRFGGSATIHAQDSKNHTFSSPSSHFLYHHCRASGLGCGHSKATLVVAPHHYICGLSPTVVSASRSVLLV